MRQFLSILSLVLCISMLGCSKSAVKPLGGYNKSAVKPLGICYLGGYPLPEGKGLDSELKYFKSVKKINQDASIIHLVTNILNFGEGKVEKPGIGVTMLIKKSGEEKMYLGACSDFDGKIRLEIDPGIYNVEVSYTGYNSLILKNVIIPTGKIFDGKIRLGGAGKEKNTMVVDLGSG